MLSFICRSRESQHLTYKEIKFSSFAYFHATSMYLNWQPRHFELIRDRQNFCHLGFVHTKPEKFESGVFTLKNASNVFRPHYAGEILKRNNHRSFWICVWGRLEQGNHMVMLRHRFRNVLFSNCFPSTLKHKACVFKFFRFEERFRKASFSWRISVDGRPNRRQKAALSNFLRLSVFWTPEETLSTNLVIKDKFSFSEIS